MIEQKYHSIGIIGFGARGQLLAETIGSELPEYGMGSRHCRQQRKSAVPSGSRDILPQLQSLPGLPGSAGR